jgi:hypothetical protein
MNRYSLFFLLAAILLLGCGAPKPPAERAYYFWKSDFRLSPNEQRQLFDTLQIKRLYLKFFDVAWNAATSEPQPLDNMNIETVLPENIRIVPTVFITNETLQRIDSLEIDSLAQRIATKIIEKTTNANLAAQVNEWQIDCDWSGKTKDKYFALLNGLKRHFPNKNHLLSVTIRLHQLKYPKKTGVPPANRGILMLYNMSNVRLAATKNSILDIDITKQYINERTKYALPLDIALPAFSWSVAFRGEAFQGLYNNWTADFCAKQSFLKKTSENRWLCTKDTTYKERYWRRGDVLRTEGGSTAEIRELYDITKRLHAPDTVRVALFSWDSTLYNYYKKENINAIFSDYE